MTATLHNSRPRLPVVGEVLDHRFELREIVGFGGMGRVYRAFDRRRGHEVALKLLLPRYLGRPLREVRFLQELSLGRRATGHPNLVSYLDCGRLRHRAWPFLTMRLLPGDNLAHRLVDGPLSPTEALRLAQQVASGVRALHRQGIVHRDVTPMNVLARDGEATLIDLSHAAELHSRRDDATSRLTRKNEVLGTPHFMPPEQARAEPAQTAMDVYGFGVLLHHMLVGGLPTGRARPSRPEQRRREQPPPPIDLRTNPRVPRGAAELVRTCVALDPEHRPTIDEVIRRLDEQLEELTATDTRPTSGSITVLAPIVPVAPPRRWAAHATMALLGFLGAMMWWWDESRRQRLRDLGRSIFGGEPGSRLNGIVCSSPAIRPAGRAPSGTTGWG